MSRRRTSKRSVPSRSRYLRRGVWRASRPAHSQRLCTACSSSVSSFSDAISEPGTPVDHRNRREVTRTYAADRAHTCGHANLRLCMHERFTSRDVMSIALKHSFRTVSVLADPVLLSHTITRCASRRVISSLDSAATSPSIRRVS
jgi:hypothetical protein